MLNSTYNTEIEIREIDDDSDDISDCSEKLEDSSSAVRIPRISPMKVSPAKSRDSMADKLGFCIIDHCEIPGFVVQNPKNQLVRVHDFKEPPHLPDEEEKKLFDEETAEFKVIRESEVDIIRESEYENITMELIDALRDSTASEVLFLAQACSNDTQKQRDSKLDQKNGNQSAIVNGVMSESDTNRISKSIS